MISIRRNPSCLSRQGASGNHGGDDCWVVKTDAVGTILWEKSYGGSGDEQVSHIAVDINGGYIISAFTSSNNGDISSNHGAFDGWLIKIDDTGRIVWQKVRGSTGYDYFNFVLNTPDSGYLAVGVAGANDGDIGGLNGASDFWVVKFTKSGAISWNKVYGGPGNAWAIGELLIQGEGFLHTRARLWGPRPRPYGL